MATTLFIYIGIALILLMFSAFFSASETAIFSLSTLDISALMQEKGRAGQRIRQLLQTPRRLLITILFGNTMVNILYFSISTMASFSLKRGYNASVAIFFGVVAFVAIIMFGEVLPKTIAVKKPLTISRVASLFLPLFFRLFSVPTGVLDRLTKIFCHLLRADQKEKFITPQELKTVLRISKQEGVINPGEHEMLLEALSLKNIKAKEVMIPRVDMVKAPLDLPPDEIVALFCRTCVTKLPIYRANPDDILGIIYAKEFLLDPQQALATLMHQVPFVLENIDVESLLKLLRSEQQTAALVVDEYGGIEGLITIEDVIEELVGEIADEYDHSEPLIIKLPQNSYRISGKLPLKEWLEFFQLDDPRYRCDTISGLITFLLQRIPQKGDIVHYKNLRMEVLEMKSKRVRELLLTIEKGTL